MDGAPTTAEECSGPNGDRDVKYCDKLENGAPEVTAIMHCAHSSPVCSGSSISTEIECGLNVPRA